MEGLSTVIISWFPERTSHPGCPYGAWNSELSGTTGLQLLLIKAFCVWTEFCENLLQSWGARFGGPIAILRNWTFCLFYVMAELWGSVVVSLLFWGFANQVCSAFACSTYTGLSLQTNPA